MVASSYLRRGCNLSGCGSCAVIFRHRLARLLLPDAPFFLSYLFSIIFFQLVWFITFLYYLCFSNDKVMDLRQFNDFFSECRQGFIRFAAAYVHDEMAAEDIVMEAFMYYWDNRENLPEGANIQAYVLTVIKHKCIDYLRHEQVSEEVCGELYQLYSWELSTRLAALENFEPSALFTDEIQNLAGKALESLPEQTRRVFVMSRRENMSHREIAEQLGISIKGVEFHITKANKHLRAMLKDYLLPSVVLAYLWGV